MQESRTKKAFRNSTTTLICQLVGIIISFISRTVFTLLLGSEYLGIVGLFSNILTILSFAELGFGSAIVYRLYAPLANEDYNTVRLYMRLYKKVYTVISLFILIVGVSLVPFLKYLVEAPAVAEDMRLLYCLYLLHTVLSYVCIYKKSLLIADQNDYIVSFISQLFSIAMHVTQIIVLLITHNFILYCILLSAFTLFDNLVCSHVANKKYVFLEMQTEGNLPQKDIFGLKKDIKGLLLTKIAATVLSGTDNIFISSFVGISYVGILSNYSLIMITINTVMNKIFSSVTSIVGNLAVKEDRSQTEVVLFRMYFLNASMYSFICIGMLLLISEFVTSIWLNAEYALSNFVIIVAILELFFRSLHFPVHTVQMAMGLFSQYRIMYLVAAILNIVLDFILVRPLGIAGLILATIFCRCIIFITDIYVVYKYGFKKSLVNYIWMVFSWLAFMAVGTLVTKFVLSFVTVSGCLGFGIRIFFVFVTYCILFILIYHRNKDFLYYKNFIWNFFRRKMAK